MTVLPDLERQLVQAAERATGKRRRPFDRVGARRIAGGFALAAILGTTLVVGLGAVILLSGRHRSPGETAAPAGAQQLVQIIGVLRRPQTPADLNARILSNLQNRPPVALEGRPDVPLIRFATTTPWGQRLYFVPMQPPTLRQLRHVLPNFSGTARLVARRAAQGETLTLQSAQGSSGGGTASTIEAGYGLSTEGAGRSFAGGSTKTRLILIVPDGVTRVAFVLPRQPFPGLATAPIYRRSATVTAVVHNNVAAVEVDREIQGATPMIWYSADGRVIKRIGNPSKANRVIPPPKPAPQTLLSRAAERDPSTPNTVWVTPNLGGPHTNFMLHFKVLLNDADYVYHLTGTSCPAITVNGGSGGGTNDLRGRTWSDVVDAVQGQTWCPGTYHLSATVMDLGRYGQLKHPAKPFGTATFTVRP